MLFFLEQSQNISHLTEDTLSLGILNSSLKFINLLANYKHCSKTNDTKRLLAKYIFKSIVYKYKDLKSSFLVVCFLIQNVFAMMKQDGCLKLSMAFKKPKLHVVGHPLPALGKVGKRINFIFIIVAC